MSVRVDAKIGVGGFAVPGAALLALWIATHPYKGILHDGRLYTVQALNVLLPERYAQDLYFKFGSQDSLTFYSLLYGPIVAAFGPAGGHFCATVLGAAAFVAALIYFMRSLFAERWEAIGAIFACIALDASYGGLNVFHYGEAFATPRIFAEALVMAALALGMRERLIGSVLCLLAATAIHPLMAMTGMAVVCAFGAYKDRRVMLAIAGSAMLGILLAAAGVEPFARLFVSFDPEWFPIVWKRCGFAFVSRWGACDVLHLAAVASTLWVAHTLGSATERWLIVCVAVTTAGGLLVTLVGGDFFHNVFLVNIQPWRILWLDTLLANASIAVILVRLPAGRFSRELFWWAAGLSLLTTLRLELPPIAALSQLFGALAFGLEIRHRSPPPKLFHLLFLIVPVAGVPATAYFLYLKAGTPDLWGAVTLIGLAAAALAVLALYEACKRSKVPVDCCAAAAAVAGLALFDQRADWQRFVDSPASPPEFTAFIAGSRNIYWDEGVELFWFKLGRPIYYSCLQGSGAMFYKGTAMEFQRRSDGLAALNSHDFSANGEDICMTKPLPGQTGATSSDQLKRACQALPELDAIVLPYRVSGVRSSSWESPAEREYKDDSNAISYSKTYYKYLCEDFRYSKMGALSRKAR